ncbi:pyridoxamine 5'-phosphate oxidase [Rhizobium sp. Root1203]|uniref:HugZ family pyridoxamine 5'-phosphate oxidase n=1 Tax=Rhizobium sp. Root1203 TaxID=1736427 RepID=UPI00070FEC1C|nr:pyridoxamine 5'-phosphate oxidase family protein [Rhizobium sp. Root1203]KQV30681.1 pyridoxamine 5'-phosphate oxidase [Rhizobium sp. Root1203]
MKDQASVLRETDGEARKLARTLLRSARYAAIAVLDPETGFPFASRVLLGTDIDGVPVILVSGLSAHTRALDADVRASLLTGEPGKGDPLAYARLTTQCRAEPVDRDSVVHARIRGRFLNRHAKAKLYIDFPDFRFFRLVPQSASMNGGFGRAYVLEGADLAIRSSANETVAAQADEILRDLLDKNPDLARDAALTLKGADHKIWGICGLDCGGLDLISGEILLRYELETVAQSASELYSHISKIKYAIPQI